MITDKCDIVITDIMNRLDKNIHYDTKNGFDTFRWLIVNKHYHATMCSRLFKRSIIFDNNLMFKNLICDDEEWTPKILLNSKRVGVVPINIYRRRTLETSVTGIKTEENYYRKSIDRIITAKELLNFFSEINITDRDLLAHAISIYFGALDIYSYKIDNNNYKKDIELTVHKNKEIINYFKNSRNIKHKLFYLMIKVFGVKTSLEIFKLMLRFNQKVK